MYLPILLAMDRWGEQDIFKRNGAGLNSEFSFLVDLPRLINTIC